MNCSKIKLADNQRGECEILSEFAIHTITSNSYCTYLNQKYFYSIKIYLNFNFL